MEDAQRAEEKDRALRAHMGTLEEQHKAIRKQLGDIQQTLEQLQQSRTCSGHLSAWMCLCQALMNLAFATWLYVCIYNGRAEDAIVSGQREVNAKIEQDMEDVANAMRRKTDAERRAAELEAQCAKLRENNAIHQLELVQAQQRVHAVRQPATARL